MTTTPRPKRTRPSAKVRWALRVGAGVLGIAAGELCPLLPVGQQVICHFAAKVVAFVVGGGA